MLRRGAIALAWAGLELSAIQGCGGFLDPIAARGTGGAGTGGAGDGSGGYDAAGGIPGGGGGAGAGCSAECVLVPNEQGWVEQQDAVCCPFQGAWYPYNDCNDSPPPNCAWDQVPAPDAGTFQPDQGLNRMCTHGTSAPVGEAGASNIWGAGIGLWLNQVRDTEIHNSIGRLRMPFGFRFTLTGTLGSNGLRVNFPYTDSDPVPHYVTITQPGDPVEVEIANAQQGTWVADASTIDPARVVAIQFAIPAGSDAVAFDFCVNTLTALYAP
jgi:hypothetical protein